MRRNHDFFFFLVCIGWAGGERLGLEMMALARLESWNKEASLCCLLCPGFLPGRIWDWGERQGEEGSSLLDSILYSVPIRPPHPIRHFKWPLFSPSLPLPSGPLCRNQ